MSIAVRVSVWILGVLVLISAGVAVMVLLQKQTLQQQNQRLQNNINEDQASLSTLSTKASKLESDAEDLRSKITQAQQAKDQVQSQFDDLKSKSDALQSELSQANSDRDDWKNRVTTISQERDDLMQKLRNRPTKIVYRTRIVHVPSAAPAEDQNGTSAVAVDVTSGQGDQYWASVLRQKAALQVELEKERVDLDQAALQVVALKKENSDLELSVKTLSNEKDEIIQKIKYGQDLADNLSIDLARSRNDQKAVNDRADKLKEQNYELQSEIRDLTSSKIELERNVSRLTDEKDSMQRKLIETESVIQSRIDDIWKIKESLDKKLTENAPTTGTSGGSMELPPIIVNTPNNQQEVSSNPAPVSGGGKTEGSIISINESNNFVIVDLGQANSSVGIANILKVYRNSNQIATLEVIQVRRDICAADIKDKSEELKVGDVVRL